MAYIIYPEFDLAKQKSDPTFVIGGTNLIDLCEKGVHA